MVEKFEIERGIPIPPVRRPGYAPGHGNRRPWGEMRVGDSFFVPEGVFSTEQTSASLRARRHNHVYTVRRVEGGIRVWRVG